MLPNTNVVPYLYEQAAAILVDFALKQPIIKNKFLNILLWICRIFFKLSANSNFLGQTFQRGRRERHIV